MKTTVAYYMKGEPKQYRTFETRAEANAFMLALNNNPNCEGYGVER
jgi:hypothetical protein